MDWRHRVYYRINLNQNHAVGGWWGKGYDHYGLIYDNNLRTLIKTIPSLKIKPVGFTRVYCYKDCREYYQLQVSCLHVDEDLLIDTLRKLPKTNYEKIEED